LLVYLFISFLYISNASPIKPGSTTAPWDVDNFPLFNYGAGLIIIEENRVFDCFYTSKKKKKKHSISSKHHNPINLLSFFFMAIYFATGLSWLLMNGVPQSRLHLSFELVIQEVDTNRRRLSIAYQQYLNF